MDNAVIHRSKQIRELKKESPNTYEDIKRVITTKIKKRHLTNYLKHSFRIYKNK